MKYEVHNGSSNNQKAAFLIILCCLVNSEGSSIKFTGIDKLSKGLENIGKLQHPSTM